MGSFVAQHDHANKYRDLFDSSSKLNCNGCVAEYRRLAEDIGIRLDIPDHIVLELSSSVQYFFLAAPLRSNGIIAVWGEETWIRDSRCGECIYLLGNIRAWLCGNGRKPVGFFKNFRISVSQTGQCPQGCHSGSTTAPVVTPELRYYTSRFYSNLPEDFVLVFGAYHAATGEYYFSGDSASRFWGTVAVAPLVGAIRGPVRGTIGGLRSAGARDAHHIIQDAAVRDLPGYNTRAAPGVQLPGPANAARTPHGRATAVQRQAGGGTYAAERRIGYKALRRAGISEADARSLILWADDYFQSIGVNPDTVTRIPGNR